MKIRPRNIPKFQTGNNIWYSKIVDYDPTRYIPIYDTSRLVDGDMSDTKLTPWKSNISGYDQGRYQPTSGYGAFGENKGHYNYTLGVEGQDYYKKFGEDLLDTNGNFTPTGEAWARAVDALLPPGSRASFYDNNNKIRGTWTTQYNDAHGRSAKTYNTLRDYVNAVRNDQILGARHNVFLKKGKRYFYTDNEGNKHWVDPEVAKNYTVSKNPIEQGWEGTTYWDDYELTGPGGTPNPDGSNPDNQTDPTKSRIPVGHTERPNYLANLSDRLKERLPGLLATGRLAGSLWNNSRVYGEALKGIKPSLKQTYYTHRQVVGDEATKQGFYRRAAEGQTKAARPFTSDADRQMAYQFEAKRIGDELRAQGDLADNQEIRRTSDESNQHQWANTQRATEVANANIESLNRANAEKHNLLAQKHSANWTSWDNYLKGIEYRARQRQAEDRAYDDQIWMLEHQYDLENDPELLTLKKEASDAFDKKSPDAQEKLLKFKQKQKEKYVEFLKLQRDRRANQPIYFGEKGFKVKRTRKDDLLYKSTRDAVEHFRKMSKMSSDALNRPPVKIEKLTSHPKGTSRKYQQGGVAPFTIYTPVALGGETTTTSNAGLPADITSKSKSSEGKDKNEVLDMIKDLFKSIAGKGLHSDVNDLYLSMSNFLAKSAAFGTSMTTEDIASMYLKQLNQVNMIERYKAQYDQAAEEAAKNDALREFAVTTSGKYVVQSSDGEIHEKGLNEIKRGEDILLTNEHLLKLRDLSPEYKFDTRLPSIVLNGIGISKVQEYIKGTLLPSIKSNSSKDERFVKASQGIAALESAPEGDYKQTITNKNNLQQAQYALNYIKSALPQNMQSVLKLHAAMQGTDINTLLATYISSQTEVDTSTEYTPYTGKAAKDANGNSGDADSTNSAGLAFVLGQGPRQVIEFNTGTSNAIKAVGIKGVLQTSSQENLGQGATLKDATKSQQGGYLKWGEATFGGSRLNSSAYDHIILNDSTIMGVDLPYKTNIQGNDVPNFQMLRNMEQAEDEIRKLGIQDNDYAKINEIYQKHELPPKYNQNGQLNSQSYKRFAALQVTLDQSSLQDSSSILSDEVARAGDIERKLYEQIVKKSTQDKNYELSNGYLWGIIGKEELYKGTIFVPYDEDVAFAALSSGKPFKQDLPNNSSKVQLMQHAPAVLNYKAPDKTLSQIKNN